MDSPLEIIDQAVEEFGRQWRSNPQPLNAKTFETYAARLRAIGAAPEHLDLLFKRLLSREIHERLQAKKDATLSPVEYYRDFPGRREQIDEALRGAARSPSDDGTFGPLRDLERELPQPENMIGPYERIEQLGAGGMGEVWLVRHARSRKAFALKQPHKTKGHGSGARDASSARDLLLMWREAESQGELMGLENVVQIEEVYIPPIQDCSEQELERILRDDPPYIVMELIEGGSTLADVLCGEYERRRAVEIVAETARALSAAHARGVYHRDVKPANILLTRDGQVKLGDFGLAVPFEAQARFGFAGTPIYMAPEQVLVQTAHANSAPDIWALGVMLYEALSARHPFATYHGICNHHPQPLRELDSTIPPELAAICDRCLQKKPADRYTSVGDVAQELRAWLERQEIDERLFPAPDYFHAYLHERRTGAAPSKSTSSPP